MFKPFITGISGTELTSEEVDFIKEHKPWGIILFARNVSSVAQLSALTDKLKQITNRVELPILIDQEGGRVARLKGSEWREYPAAASFYEGYKVDANLALDAIRLNAALQGAELRKVGVTVNCAPMIDVRAEGADNIIGDRAFSTKAPEVIDYGRSVIEGLSSQCIVPVIKHIPGHGRATCDSHEALPQIDETIDNLMQDFEPFKALNDAPLAMTAHILYSKLDEQQCATLSESVIRHAIRGMIGFSGLLMSDDISMKALEGDLGDLSQRILKAGCDLVLHCNGKIDEMRQVAESLEVDKAFLALRTDKIFADLHLKKAPRSELDLMEEYQEVMAKLMTKTMRRQHG